MNVVVQSGNLVKDSEFKAFDKGMWINFTIAVKKDEKVPEGEQDAYFRNVKYWTSNKESKFPSYLTKGARVTVSGRWITRKWTGSDGVTKYFEEINAREVELVRKAEDAPAPVGSGVGSDTEGDLPF